MTPLAVIFDVDGVLVDSYTAHWQSWRVLAQETGVEFTSTQFAASFGRTSREIIAEHWGDIAETDAAIAKLDFRKESRFRDLVSSDFPAMDGAVELIRSLHEAGFRLAVGSSGPPENVNLALEKLAARDLMQAVVAGDDVRRGKPDPEVFLLAATRLGMPPPACIVIEDAPAGIIAARRAGMAAVAMLSEGRARADFQQVPPDLFVTSLRQLSPEAIRTLHHQRVAAQVASDRTPSGP